jgi:ferredoxin--NADP+ reductase
MCGNPSMIDVMIELLGEQGYQEHTKKQPGQIHLERYW